MQNRNIRCIEDEDAAKSQWRKSYEVKDICERVIYEWFLLIGVTPLYMTQCYTHKTRLLCRAHTYALRSVYAAPFTRAHEANNAAHTHICSNISTSPYSAFLFERMSSTNYVYLCCFDPKKNTLFFIYTFVTFNT